MTSNKPGVSELVSLLYQGGVEQVVISPGSRNAPLIIALDAHHSIECKVVTDERSAAFAAMGMALAAGKPVALCCTSGSAMLNYGPAVAEAFYREIPLVLLTADRPLEAIDKGMGQTIRQFGALDNHLVYSAQLIQEPTDDASLQHNNQLVSQALHSCLAPRKGPVHLNIPFLEPLYGTTAKREAPKLISALAIKATVLGKNQITQQARIVSKKKKVLILAGQMEPGEVEAGAIAPLLELPQVVLMSETTSNMPSPRAVAGIDNCLTVLSEDEKVDYAPDLLITTGKAVISKMVKAWLRENPPAEHWHVSSTGQFRDTYQAQTQAIAAAAGQWLHALSAQASPEHSHYAEKWQALYSRIKKAHRGFWENLTWSDFAVYKTLLQSLDGPTTIHWGNSSPIRYAQLFSWPAAILHYGNRGTSGIDGSVSTAVGYALNRPGENVILVTGDIAFFYDSNGLWQDVPKNLTILMIHNGGGGIFRIIKGPEATGEPILKKYFQAENHLTGSQLAAAYGMQCREADTARALTEALAEALSEKTNEPVFIEANTRGIDNSGMLKSYFQHLKNNR